MTPLLLLAEARGESESRYNSTLIGASGIELIRMLSEAGAMTLDVVDHELIDLYYSTQNSKHLMTLWDKHPYIHRTNVFNLHPPNNDLNHFLGPKSTGIPGYPSLKIPKGKGLAPGGSFVQAQYAPELERLGDEILYHNPNLIVALGNTALWALTGGTGVKKLRGTTLNSSLVVSDYKLLPTYHPAYILRNHEDRATVIADLAKAARECQYPEIRRPQREIWIEIAIEDLREFTSRYIRGCSLLSIDIETACDRITCIGFAPDSSHAIVVPFDDARAATGNYWSTASDEQACWCIIRNILEDPTTPKLFQNGAYDIAFLYRSMKIRVLGATHDTMLLHHALQPEALKSLGFLGSIYSSESSWKGMRKAKTTKRDD